MNKPHQTDPIRILILEDSAKDAELIMETMQSYGGRQKIDIASNKEEYLETLKKEKYDIILADYKLPSFDAPEALKIARDVHPGLPFICISGAIGEEAAVDFLKLGATDYILKDRIYRLPNAVQRAVEAAKLAKNNELTNLAIKESQQLFDTITNHIPLMIWMSGSNRERNWFNKSWLSFRARTEMSEQFNNWLEGIHKDDLEKVKGNIEKAYQSKQSYKQEYRLQRSDGQFRWMREEGAPRYNQQNEFVGFIGVCTDVTDNKLMEHKVKHLKSILDVQSNVMNIAMDKAGAAERVARIYESALSLEHMQISCILSMKDMDETGKLHLENFKVSKVGYNAYVQYLVQNNLPVACPVMKVFKTNKHEICNYLKDEEAMTKCKSAVLSLGIKAVAAFPLMSGNKTVAALVFCSTETEWLEKEELKQLDNLANNISRALEFVQSKTPPKK
jgi:PAS domain S-box-containing protein